ncbi:M56 family metallopeptidase [Leptolyngbya sp. AN02str]|uniref:M56 family metallopeptidase n=1 Tax=Leptolyngbya sp. AN02str TaxID=3423363 RepID=UPI003D3158DB
MHLMLLLLGVAIACGIRLGWRSQSERCCETTVLIQFLLPPGLVGATCLAVLGMGTHGKMLGHSVGWFGFGLAAMGMAIAVGLLLWQYWLGWRSVQQLRQFPYQLIDIAHGYVIPHALPYAAQIGFWRSHLVVSQGLIARLSRDQLQAVLTHERAHQQFHDTFWFFWLGWIRRLTVWLPHTHHLWQELLLLRELRADAWAAQQVDPLLLAETLLQVVQSSQAVEPDWSAAFGTYESAQWLQRRIDALISPAPVPMTEPRPIWLWVFNCMTLLPLATLWFHH